MIKQETMKAQLFGPASDSEVIAGTLNGISAQGIDGYFLSLAVDFAHGRFHDWRVYVCAINEMAGRTSHPRVEAPAYE